MSLHFLACRMRFCLPVLILFLFPLHTFPQSSEKLFAGVAFPLDGPLVMSGLQVSSLETPEWKSASWPGFPLRTMTIASSNRSSRLLLGGPGGLLLPFTNPTGWQLLADWRLTDVLDVKVDPFAEQVIFVATATGIYISRDRGATWQPRNNGLASKFVSCLLFDPRQSGHLMAGTESGLYESSDHGANWRLLEFSGIPVRAMLREPESFPGIYWVGTEYRGLFESFDGGKIFEPVDMQRDSVSVYALAGGGANAPIYAGLFEHGLYSASSPGENWSPMESSKILGTVFCILPLEEHKIIFAGTHRNGVMRSDDHGRTWRNFGLKGVAVRALIAGEAGWSKP